MVNTTEACTAPAPGTAGAIVADVADPEMPMLTLTDLGVVRSVDEDGDHVVVAITPTYSGCPALQEMHRDIRTSLLRAGYRRVDVRTVLAPAWSTDWITDHGRRKLAAAGIAPPQRLVGASSGSILLTLNPPPVTVRCPRCGDPGTRELSRFGPTACTSLRRCPACLEPFEHMKEI
jgi:ring-1,2-phenylacetyl-CoA epoxidase subunit PaaD